MDGEFEDVFADIEAEERQKKVDDIRYINHQLKELEPDVPPKVIVLPGELIKEHLANAMQQPEEATESIDFTERDDSPLMKWPTGISRWDELTGGGYGSTVIAGEPKLGKSMCSLGAAINAAEAGWFVVYIDAELNSREWKQRFWRYMGTKQISKKLLNNLRVEAVNPGATPDQINKLVSSFIAPSCKKLLVILDSINRLTANSFGDYWANLQLWDRWGTQAAKLSDGAISFLIVSEMNTAGGVKGRALEYSANQVILMTEGEVNGEVNLEVKFSRSTVSGKLGIHQRDASVCRFTSLGDPVNDN